MKDRGYIIPRQKGEILPSSLTSYQPLYRISRNFSRGRELDNKRHEYPRVWRCLSPSQRRAPHKLLPSRDTQARKLYSFLVSISSPARLYPATVCKYRLSHVWMVEFLPDGRIFFPLLPSLDSRYRGRSTKKRFIRG